MAQGAKRKPDRFKIKIPSRYLLLIITICCTGLIVLTYNTNIVTEPINNTVGFLVVPFQNGITRLGTWMVDQVKNAEHMKTLEADNDKLRKENEELKEENMAYANERKELEELRSLYKIDGQYSSYPKTAARVISRSGDNWYYSFVIDKGTEDGLDVDMNVLSGAGLVGRITSVGKDWARVDSIIEDNMNVTGEVLNTSTNCVVSGNLQLYDKGRISYSRLSDPDNKVKTGDKIVTSSISDKYLPGILIGYISSIEKDANNITKSGEVTPAVDFGNLNLVLVITQKKQTVNQ